jgi:hypothetical protein
MENQVDSRTGAKAPVSGRILEGTSKVFTTVAAMMEHVSTAVRLKADKVVKDLNEYKTLPYESVMSYFPAHQTDDPHIAKGALVRERLDWGGQRVYQVFLDKDYNLVEDGRGNPLGRTLTAISFDKELEAVFQNHNVVIVE